MCFGFLGVHAVIHTRKKQSKTATKKVVPADRKFLQRLHLRITESSDHWNHCHRVSAGSSSSFTSASHSPCLCIHCQCQCHQFQTLTDRLWRLNRVVFLTWSSLVWYCGQLWLYSDFRRGLVWQTSPPLPSSVLGCQNGHRTMGVGGGGLSGRSSF